MSPKNDQPMGVNPGEKIPAEQSGGQRAGVLEVLTGARASLRYCPTSTFWREITQRGKSFVWRAIDLHADVVLKSPEFLELGHANLELLRRNLDVDELSEAVVLRNKRSGSAWKHAQAHSLRALRVDSSTPPKQHCPEKAADKPGQADLRYNVAFADYYRSLGMHEQARMIEHQVRKRRQAAGGTRP
ncbi:hypothetical protein AAVH_26294 [Aphelenchoides avenae]|nr:hypothetical protein AAVH_26294 [Aphelenchus avenae]